MKQLNYSRYAQYFRENLRLALPIMGGQLGQIMVNLADNIMVGRLGAASLAAVSLANSIFVVFIVLGFGLSFALPPLISEAHGANESKRISQYFKHSLVINLVFAVVAFILILLGLPLLEHMGQDPEVVALAHPYLLIMSISLLPLMIFQTLRCYSDGLSETMPPMIAIIAGNIINVVMNYCLIYGKWGFPKMGVTGAATGSLIARVLMMVIIMVIIWQWKDIKKYIQAVDFKKYKNLFFIKILNLGIPSSLQGFFEISAFSGAALIMGIIGKNEQAAHQIAINLASITFLICSGFSMAATIRVGNQLGKKDYPTLRDIGFSTFIQVSAFMLIGAAIFALCNELLPQLYIDDDHVVSIAAMLLLFAAVFQIPDGVQVVALGALRGLQDVLAPTRITFISYWLVGLPISYLTAITYGYGPKGVWLGLILGLTVSSAQLVWRFHKKTRALIKSQA